jgi:hypothetical protein
MQSNFTYAVNGYPSALAMDSDHNLVNFSSPTAAQAKGLMLTRPIKLGDGDVLKTITTAIQRGQFRRGYVFTILYGSRDLRNWHIISSSLDHYLRRFSGSPYKYFRFGAIAQLSATEGLAGVSVDYSTRYTNQLR